MLVCKSIYFYLYDNVAFEYAVVKHQVCKKVSVVNQYAFLSGFETETIAQL
jgi:hypothetical protein